jgi:hypothetical protein
MYKIHPLAQSLHRHIRRPRRLYPPHDIQERIAVLNEKYRIRCSLAIRDKTDIPGQTGTGTIITLVFPAHEEELIW